MASEVSVCRGREGVVEQTHPWWQGQEAEVIRISAKRQREKPEQQDSYSFQNPAPVTFSTS